MPLALVEDPAQAEPDTEAVSEAQEAPTPPDKDTDDFLNLGGF